MTKKYAFKKGFTLAEVMIVLTVIGVLTAILLPVARQSMPDEDLMKFKKAHNTLGTVIRELVASDKYYLDGEFGKKPNGDWVEDSAYFCKTFSDLINTKKSNCQEFNLVDYAGIVSEDWELNGALGEGYKIKNGLDDACNGAELNNYILTSDNVTFYEPYPENPFGMDSTDKYGFRNAYYWVWNKAGYKPTGLSPSEEDEYTNKYYKDGFYFIYKLFCIDVDAINQGEAPFGYGIRIDGKILTGKRADEWLERDVNEE